MRNKKGFTLIELIFVILILGIILAFSLPNISSTLQKNKKDQMIVDAKDMVEKTKTYMLTYSAYPTNKNTPTDTTDDYDDFLLNEIDPREEIKTSPYGAVYNRDDSYVRVWYNKDSETNLVTYKYYIYLTDEENNVIKESDGSAVAIEHLNSSDKYSKIIVN